MRKVLLASWGKFVDSLFIAGGISLCLATTAVVQYEQSVDKEGVFSESTAGLILGFVHRYSGLFLSVVPIVLHSFHTAYNNEQQYIKLFSY